MEDAKVIRSQQTLFLPAPPSAIERSSISSSAFVVGTYSLDTTEESSAASRSGSLCVVAPSTANPHEYSIVQSYETTSAVLDLSIDNKSNSIAVANSTGGIELWSEKASPDNPNIPVLTHDQTVQAFSPEILVLSLHRNPASNRRSVFAVSLSDGSIAVIDHSKPSPLVWHTDSHSLEAWTIRWGDGVATIHSTAGYSDEVVSDTVFSGGDDSTLRVTRVPSDVLPWDPPVPEGATLDPYDNIPREEDVESLSLPQVNKRFHTAGVTAILSLSDTYESEPYPNPCPSFLTGSYDDHIRVLKWGEISPFRLHCVAELNLGGGVWRLSLIGRKVDQVDQVDRWWVLASCMYAGCRVLEISHGPEPQTENAEYVWKINIVATFEEHESMNYASAAVGDLQIWDGEKHVLEGMKIVSTSFYDRRFCVWELTGFPEDKVDFNDDKVGFGEVESSNMVGHGQD